MAIVVFQFLHLYRNSNVSAEYTRIGFIVQPQCESQVKEYFAMLSANDGIEAETFPINYTRGVFDHIEQYALIKSNLRKDSFKEMEAYVNGALHDCGTNGEVILDLREEKTFDDLENYFQMGALENRNNNSVFLRINDNKLYIFDKR